MKKYLESFIILMLFAIVFQNVGYSQTSYKVKDTKEVLKLSGTSTVHDWEMSALHSSGEAKFVFNSGNESELISIPSLSYILRVTDLKSDSDGLNENAYEALKSDEHKYIRYKLISSTIVPEKEGYLVKSKGKLTIAGVTKDIKMDVHAVVNDDGTITTKGTYKLKMSDYDIEPPSFLFGSMSAGDDLKLDFTVVYKK